MGGKRYSRVPWEVVADPRLKPRDVRVYAALASPVMQGSYSRIGTRRISESIHLSRRLVIESVLLLESCGHIEKAPTKRGQRAGYVLTSPVFGQKQSRETVVVRGASGVPRYASMEKTA